MCIGVFAKPIGRVVMTSAMTNSRGKEPLDTAFAPLGKMPSIAIRTGQEKQTLNHMPGGDQCKLGTEADVDSFE